MAQEAWRAGASLHFGARFGLISLVTVFALQGTLMWIVSLPVQLSQTSETPDIGALAVVGMVLWLVGVTVPSAMVRQPSPAFI